MACVFMHLLLLCISLLYKGGFYLHFFDILVYNKDYVSHISHLRTTLELLQKHQWVFNHKKCVLVQLKLEDLGHVISAEGVQADPKKIEYMVNWPIPKDLKALREFLGLISYYRKFVKDYGKLVAPLTALLKKDTFQWNELAQQAFESLKTAMVLVSVLAMLDFAKPFEIETDTSGFGEGAVLTQGRRPIAYFSQMITPRARKGSVYDKELMATVFAIKKWWPISPPPGTSS